MKGFFNLDNPFMIFLSNLTDVVILNVVCLLCCLPVVTIGASVTAMHYVTLKMVKEQEGYVLKNFFKSFRENFKQSTVVWLLFLFITAFFVVDMRLITVLELGNIWKMVICCIYFFCSITAGYSLVLLSRFENTIKATLKNGFLMGTLHMFRTVIMAAIYLLPFILFPLHVNMIAVFLLLGLAGPAYINSYLWKSIFKKYEPQEEEEAMGDENLRMEQQKS